MKQARAFVVASFVLVAGSAAPASVAAQILTPPTVTAPAVAPARADTAKSLNDLVEKTINDFRRIPSWETVTILTAGSLGAFAGHAADANVTRLMAGSNGLHGALRFGETIGGARTQTAAAFATFAIGRISGNEKVTRIGADLIGAQILTQTLTAGIKMSVGRTRPDGTQYSFPSGHSATTFATATVLQRNLGWKVGIPAYGLATYVAASRVQDKRHFLSDVTFGAAIGIVAGRTVTIGRGNAKFAVAPAAAPGGGAVSFTWLGKN